MKVIGIGAPRALELRLKSCELGVWRAVLGLTHVEERRRVSAAPESPSTLLELSRLRQQAAEPHREDQPFVVTGPTSVLAPLVRSAARRRSRTTSPRPPQPSTTPGSCRLTSCG